MTILESQVVEIEEDLTGIEEDVTVLGVGLAGLSENVDFLFDEQVIQDERIFTLEQASIETNNEVEGMNHLIMNYLFNQRKIADVVKKSHFVTDLQDTTVALDFRVTALEENGAGDGNSSVAELELRVETLEGTAADHEIRISASESDLTGKQVLLAPFQQKLIQYCTLMLVVNFCMYHSRFGGDC